MGKRVQVSLNFESEEELATFEDVVIPYKRNQQLRPLLLGLLNLVQTNPEVMEALLDGEKVIPFDKNAQNYLDTASKLDQSAKEFDQNVSSLGADLKLLSGDDVVDAVLNAKNKRLKENAPEVQSSLNPSIVEEIKKIVSDSLKDAVGKTLVNSADDKSNPLNQSQPTATSVSNRSATTDSTSPRSYTETNDRNEKEVSHKVASGGTSSEPVSPLETQPSVKPVMPADNTVSTHEESQPSVNSSSTPNEDASNGTTTLDFGAMMAKAALDSTRK